MEPINQQVQQPMQSDVGFPQPKEPASGKSKMVKWIIALVGIIVIVAGGAWFLLQDVGSGESNTATPAPDGLSAIPTPAPEITATPEPTPTPEPIEKSEVKIEVLNGTGTPGDAGFLQAELEKLGFENIEAGNADDQGETTTTITFARELPAQIVDEITQRLEQLYEEVTTRRGSLTDDFDVRIVTGTKTSSGAAASTASPKPSASPEVSE